MFIVHDTPTRDPLRRSRSDRADGYESRNRGLDALDEIFGVPRPADVIAQRVREGGALDVLEVGFGWGVALLQLAWRFRDARANFFGVDVEEKPALATSEGVMRFAEEQGIVPDEPRGSAAFRPPALDFYDATNLRFADESFDVVYSAVTIRFMADKIRFIEEVARVLKPGGRALLHIGESNWDYPHGPVVDAPRLTPFTSRLVLKHADMLVPVPDYFALFENEVFSFGFTRASRCILDLRKTGCGTLNLGLALDPLLTMSGRSVPLLNRKGEVRGGMRSVYEVPAAAYEALQRRAAGR